MIIEPQLNYSVNIGKAILIYWAALPFKIIKIPEILLTLLDIPATPC